MAELATEMLDTAVGKVQLLRGGSGAPLVYLHSAMGEGAGLAVLADLAGSFEVLAPVFPGFGDSEGVEEVDDIEDAAFHVLDVLDRLGLERATVMGLSLGGWLAAELATRWPERVERLVLVSPVGHYIPGAEIKELFGRRPDELARDMFADLSHPVAQVMLAMSEWTGDVGKLVKLPMELVIPMMKAMAVTARLGWDPYLHNRKLRQRLFRVKAPALLVYGVSDAFLPRAHVELYAELLPDARIVDVEGAGHLVPLERPEETARVVREFLAG
jgi:pimeloyl-ACP methyl ester carboxylesterase